MGDLALSKFMAHVGRLINSAGGIQVSALMIETPRDWRIISARVVTLAVSEKRKVRCFKRVGRLAGVSVIGKKAHVAPVLHALRGRVLVIPGGPPPQTATLEVQENSAESWTNLQCIGRVEALRRFDQDWPVHVAHHYGTAISSLISYDELSTLSSCMASDAIPYRDLHDLCRDLGVPRGERLESSSATVLELVVPVWSRLSGAETDLAGGTVTVSLESKGPRSRSTVIAVMPTRGVPKDRRLVPASSFKPVEGEPGHRSRSFRLPSGKGGVAISLSHEGRTVDTLTAGMLDVHGVAHAMVDPDLEKVRVRLLDPGHGGKGAKPQDHFEHGTGWLLHLMGFSCVHYGPLGECLDFVAFSGDGKLVLAVDCTVELPNPEKLKKLRVRRAGLQNLLRSHGILARVAPVIATCKPGSLLDHEQAEAQGILLADAEMLKTFLGDVKSGHPHSYFCKTLEKRAEDCDPEDPLKMATQISRRLFR